jgi:hypothetical protein
MAQRDSVTSGHQAAHELEATRQLGSQCDNPDIRPRRSHDVEDVARGKVTVWNSSDVPDRARSGGRPLSDIRWRAKAFGRLRAGVCRVDEVTFEMCRERAGASRRARGSCLCHLRQNTAQLTRRAGHRRRTKSRYAVSRQSRRNSRHWLTRIERVMPIDTVHVHVDEARDDVALAGVDNGRSTHVGADRWFDRRYMTSLNDE